GGDRQPENGDHDFNHSGTFGDAPNEIFSAAGTNDWVARIFRGDFSQGTPWQQIVGNGADPDGAGSAPGTAPHADSRFLLLSDGKLWEADDGGVSQLVNPANSGGAGQTRRWQSRIGNLTLAEFYSVGWQPD